MIFDPELMEEAVIERLSLLIPTDLAVVVPIGDEGDAAKLKKLPGASVLCRRGSMDEESDLVGITQTRGPIDWSIWVAGSNHRDTGRGSGRKGARGAYAAMAAVARQLHGWHIVDGLPMKWLAFELSDIDVAAGMAVYELTFRHQWVFTEDGED